MIAFIIGAALALLAGVVVLLPFLRARPAAETPPADVSAAEGVRLQREGLYRALETLRLERELGQVDAQEYTRQLEDYRRQAALLVRAQEQLSGQADAATAALERAVQAARAQQQFGGHEGGEDTPR